MTLLALLGFFLLAVIIAVVASVAVIYNQILTREEE